MRVTKKVIKEKIHHPETDKPLNDVVIGGVLYRWNTVYNHYKAVDGNGREADVLGILCHLVEVLVIDYERSK